MILLLATQPCPNHVENSRRAVLFNTKDPRSTSGCHMIDPDVDLAPNEGKDHEGACKNLFMIKLIVILLVTKIPHGIYKDM